jgi:RNA polymerase sigma-32 factor
MLEEIDNIQKKENLPVISSDLTFARYINEVKKYPTLSAEEEYMLAKRVQDYEDIEAAHKLVTSHLKLVAKMAYRMRGYGIALMDIVAEGNIGLMHAVKKFNPDLGHRLSTYAMWWIKAAMQEFIIKSWSLVKIGTTTAQKKLFFNLSKAKKRILSLSSSDNRNYMSNDDVMKVAEELQVLPQEVVEMDIRLSGNDVSLDTPIYDDDNHSVTALDLLTEKRANQEINLLKSEDFSNKKKVFTESLKILNERERQIIQLRHLIDIPETLDELSKKLNISRERVRQIEARALEKIKEYCLKTYLKLHYYDK